MSTMSNQKIKLLNVIDILKKYTDDDHPLTAEEICKELEKRNIKSERKSVYRDIETLLRYGFDINKIVKPKRGFYIASRDFELPEIKLLVDAIQTAPFITSKKTQDLAKKLTSMVSTYQAKEIFYNKNNLQIEKSLNEEIYYNIDAFNEAILKVKKVKFIYHKRVISNGKFDLDEGKECTIIPYNIMWQDNNYYIYGLEDNSKEIKKYKIELIKKAGIVNEDINKLKYYEKNKSNISEKIEFIFKTLITEEIFEKFGNDIILEQLPNEEIYATVYTYVDKDLINWFFKYGELIYVKSPSSLSKEIELKIKKMNDKYEIKSYQ